MSVSPPTLCPIPGLPSHFQNATRAFLYMSCFFPLPPRVCFPHPLRPDHLYKKKKNLGCCLCLIIPLTVAGVPGMAWGGGAHPTPWWVPQLRWAGWGSLQCSGTSWSSPDEVPAWPSPSPEWPTYDTGHCSCWNPWVRRSQLTSQSTPHPPLLLGKEALAKKSSSISCVRSIQKGQ